MLHQDGSRAAWLADAAPLDLIVTMDDATSTIYSAVPGRGGRHRLDVSGPARGVRRQGPAVEPLHRSRQPLFLHAASGRSGRQEPADPGRAGAQTPGNRAYPGLFAGGARAQRTHVRHLAGPLDQGIGEAAGIGDSRTRPTPSSATSICRGTMPVSPSRQPWRKPPSSPPIRALLAETLCIEEERIVGRDNTVGYGGRRLQLPASPARAHYVKAQVKVHEYPDGTLAVFHGPRRIAGYTAEGSPIVAAPTATSVTPCSPPSRRGLPTPEAAAPLQQRPSLTAAARGVTHPRQVGTKKRPPGRTKKLTRKTIATAQAQA